MMRKWLLRAPAPLFLLMLVLLGALSCQRNRSVEVHYQSPFEEVHVEQGRLTYLDKVHHYPPDHPMVATPDSVTTVIKVDARRVPRSRMKALRQVIISTNFFELKDKYGISERRRYYPFQLDVRLKNQRKKVMYRSNPSAGPMPDAFSTIQAYMLLLAKRMEERKP